MEVTLKEAGEFKVSKAVIDRNRGDEYQIINLVRGLDISDRSYKKVVESLGGLVNEMPAALGGTGIRVVGGKSNGKTFVGVFIGEEGYYLGLPRDKHISKNDPNAMQVMIHFAVPPEPIRKEIAARLGRAC